MSRRIFRFLALFLLAVLVMALQKGLFMLANFGVYGDVGFTAAWQAVVAGLKMDMCMAGYLTAVPGLVLILSGWLLPRVADAAMRVWYVIASFVISATFILDTVLYSYWAFKLDSTPIFYFLSSPKSAMASVEWYFIVLGVVAVTGYAVFIWWLFSLVIRWIRLDIPRRRGLTASVMALLTALLFIPIRGGLTVSTMNLSSAYHSLDARMNHAAVNPAFSLMYSLSHHRDFASEARYMDDAEAERILAEAMHGDVAADSCLLRPDVERPDIYILILESFSAHLMPSLGGEPIAVGLDSLAREGVSFTRCYASGFRTDRGIPAILSGYPCPPATSVMKFVDVAERLPNIAGELGKIGYGAEYFYGGDINFTNQLAYLKAGGFGRIMRDTDWPVSERVSKWGVDDGPMLARVWQEIKAEKAGAPMLRVIQTSSSHEPFSVPRKAPEGMDKRVNAFMYADSCVSAFVDSLRTLPLWSRTLVVLTADHYGAYPDRPAEPLARHHVPLVFVGGALSSSGVADSTLCSHTDIAPTLAALAGADAAPFVWGAPLQHAADSRTVFFTEADLVGAVGKDETIIMNPDTAKAGASLPKAWLQCNYKYLDNLRKKHK